MTVEEIERLRTAAGEALGGDVLVPSRILRELLDATAERDKLRGRVDLALKAVERSWEEDYPDLDDGACELADALTAVGEALRGGP